MDLPRIDNRRGGRANYNALLFYNYRYTLRFDEYYEWRRLKWIKTILGNAGSSAVISTF